jgi:hypothetical protein
MNQIINTKNFRAFSFKTHRFQKCFIACISGEELKKKSHVLIYEGIFAKKMQALRRVSFASSFLSIAFLVHRFILII